MNSCGTRIGKQIKEAGSIGKFLNQLPGGAVIKKQSGIEVIGQIDQELAVPLLNFLQDAPPCLFFILLISPLLLSHLQVNFVRGESQHQRHSILYVPQSLSRFLLINLFWRPILLQMDFIIIQINRNRIFGKIGIIKTIAVDVLFGCPFFQFFQILPQPVGKHFTPGREVLFHRLARPLFKRLPAIGFIQFKLQQLAFQRTVVKDIDLSGTQSDAASQLRF